MHGQQKVKDRWTDRWSNRQTEGRADRQRDERTDGQRGMTKLIVAFRLKSGRP